MPVSILVEGLGTLEKFLQGGRGRGRGREGEGEEREEREMCGDISGYPHHRH